MIKEIIDCIPSKMMQAHLYEHPVDLTVLQQATIVSEYAPKEQKAALLESLMKPATPDAERLLLEAAIKDIKEYGCLNTQTGKIYNALFMGADVPPFFPFLEVCRLPVLFKKGDVICAGGEYFYVAALPEIKETSDFTDECYLCYSLSNTIRDEADLFSAHDHIHVCVADAADLEALGEEQRKVAATIPRLCK